MWEITKIPIFIKDEKTVLIRKATKCWPILFIQIFLSKIEKTGEKYTTRCSEKKLNEGELKR